ncbi:MAG TPA: Spy/CpxP family protein refolding chaperone [Vicinamibacterales bacterium]|nr:Spy/CpxP family protein refolding chaperone [Vicinamibacterales bacterium]
MIPTWARRLLAAMVLLLASAAAIHAQSFGFAWWRDADFQRDLGLTADQVSRIESVFQAAVPALRGKKADLDQQEDELSRLVGANADEALVSKQVDKVEAIRSHMNKARTLMLLHMRQVLTPDQRVKLNKRYEQWAKDHNHSRGDK